MATVAISAASAIHQPHNSRRPSSICNVIITKVVAAARSSDRGLAAAGRFIAEVDAAGRFIAEVDAEGRFIAEADAAGRSSPVIDVARRFAGRS